MRTIKLKEDAMNELIGMFTGNKNERAISKIAGIVGKFQKMINELDESIEKLYAGIKNNELYIAELQYENEQFNQNINKARIVKEKLSNLLQ
jgi:peptidoglycan hydrolase CwlO-like protein